jgi:hypothetical protein
LRHPFQESLNREPKFQGKYLILSLDQQAAIATSRPGTRYRERPSASG